MKKKYQKGKQKKYTENEKKIPKKKKKNKKYKKMKKKIPKRKTKKIYRK